MHKKDNSNYGKVKGKKMILSILQYLRVQYALKKKRKKDKKDWAILGH